MTSLSEILDAAIRLVTNSARYINFLLLKMKSISIVILLVSDKYFVCRKLLTTVALLYAWF
uniref:Uncharacterized protein n=1 Tax=Solanum lycopersicum TaxID=4081 RepID=A0A3Q7HLB0_SOLLC